MLENIKIERIEIDYAVWFRK